MIEPTLSGLAHAVAVAAEGDDLVVLAQAYEYFAMYIEAHPVLSIERALASQFTRQKIIIKTTQGDMTIEAKVFGESGLAYHQPFSHLMNGHATYKLGEGYCITHILSGTTLVGAGECDEPAQAEQLIRRLAECGDWNTATSKETSSPLIAKYREVMTWWRGESSAIDAH